LLKIPTVAGKEFGAKTIRQRQGKCIGQRHAILNFVTPNLLPKRFVHVLTNGQPSGAKVIKGAPCRVLSGVVQEMIEYLAQVYGVGQTHRRLQRQTALDDFGSAFVTEKGNHSACVEDKVHCLAFLSLDFLSLLAHKIVAAKPNPSVLSP